MLRGAIDKDQVFLVALIIDEDGTIANAAKFPMAQSQTPIRSINSEQEEPVYYYSLDGKRMNVPAKGLNIVKLSDGRTIKVIK